MYKTLYALLLLNTAALSAVYAQQTPTAPQRTTATWTSVASMTDKRAEHMAAAVGGRIYVWGGYTGAVYPYALPVNSLETYDVGANTWTRTPASTVVGRDLSSAVGPNGLVYVIGTDAGGAGRNLRFEPATNTVTTLQAPAANHFAGAAAAGLDGNIYVFGGYAATATSIYNPTANTWTTGASIPGGRHSHVAVRDAAGLIHLIGGGVASPSSYYLDGAGTNVHLVYNPVTNSWTTRAPLPALLFEAAATLGADGNIYFIGGSTEKYFNAGNFVSSVYIYNPTTDVWTNGPSLPDAVSEAQAVTSGNYIYVLGGNLPFTCMTCNGERQTTRVLQLDTSQPLATRGAWRGEVQVYPNPVTGRQLTITATDLHGAADVRLRNALGQVVRSEVTPPTNGPLKLQWTLGALPAGVYTLQVQAAAGALTRRIVVP